ncbi:MAG TPA: GH3 auxin-responsive promoter family protein [Bryobacteraceae bacterium]
MSERARFLRATNRVEEEQRAILRRILDENADTEFGKLHGFSSIRSAAEFRERVPLRDYDQHEAWISRAASGVPNVLTRERVRLFEPTSGSSGATKLIPYTPSLQREFQRGIRAWIADIFAHFPALLASQAYWSVSPVSSERKKTPGGVPIGFDDDTSYVGGWQRRLVNSVMAVPGGVRLTSDIDDFRYRTLLFLVRSRTLGLISVWNPTYLSLLLDRLPEWGDRLSHDLARGTFCRPEVSRSRELLETLRAKSPQERYARLWPKLGFISCWADANAAAPAAMLAGLFPHSRVQPKGLIATEAFVSFPLVGQEHAALAIRSHFQEFVPVGSDRPQLAHQLERGAQYTVVATTSGGLYRYQLGDLIEVTGHIRGCPLIRFLGRQSYVSDWFGEKLNDAHVSRVIEETFGTLNVAPAFAMLACNTDAPPGYELYIDSPERDELLDRAAEMIDGRLRQNFHYDYARQLGQLACVRAVRVRDGAGAYLAAAIRNGQKPGDVKAPALEKHDGWSGVFEPITLDRFQDIAPHTIS